ncbi:MAG: succinate dehydrogenase assembly factor 2 [Sphingorhabdus sp.]
MDKEAYLRRLRYRAHYRGTREADAIVGGFFDAYHQGWDENEFAWFEKLLDEQDADIVGWALGTIAPPADWAGPMMDMLKRLDYIALPLGLAQQTQNRSG